MNTANDIQEELMNMGSSLAGISRTMPYAVPVNYFDHLPAETLKTAIEESPAWSKAATYNTPDGYFEKFADNILNIIKAENIGTLISREMPHSLPATYFEGLPAQMLLAAKKSDIAKKTATRISLGQRNSFRQVRWAAAAVLLICIGFGGYQTFFSQPQNPENMLASVPNNEIQDYLQHTYILDMNRVLSSSDINSIEVENKDIIQYLNETGWDMTE